MSLINPFDMPGMGTPAESTEREFLWGNRETLHLESGVIVSTAVDATNTPTTTLRRGRLMGIVTASGKWKQYDPAAVDGSEVAAGVLYEHRNMLNLSTGSAQDTQGQFVVKGFVKAGQLLGLDALARRQMFGRFLFDDDFAGLAPVYRKVVVKATDYTVTVADNDVIFTTRGAVGAVTFTLPALARGLRFTFFNEADQNMLVVAGTADTMVTFNDLAADSVAFSTAGEKIGAWVEVIANDDASKWMVRQSIHDAQTATIAT